jgi:hypothetical protein
MGRSQAVGNMAALTVLSAEPGLSLASKGLAMFILSRPRRPITRAELFRCNADPMPVINYSIAELVRAGLVKTVKPSRRGDRSTGAVILKAS